MAKLYPPYIAGTLPPIVQTGPEENGSIEVSLSIPFSMNKTVSLQSVVGIFIRIKHAYTDSVLAEITATGNDIDWDNYEIHTSNIIPASVGQFYKVQLAYVNANDAIGYYSTVGIAKCTSKPTICIANLEDNYDTYYSGKFYGIYKNEEDPTESVYKYRFVFTTEDGEELFSTPWKLHNSLQDPIKGESVDIYEPLGFNIEERQRVHYEVMTVNGYAAQSINYSLYYPNMAEISMPIQLTAKNQLDYGNIQVAITPDINKTAAIKSSNFCLYRADDESNFSKWTMLAKFNLVSNGIESFTYNDFCIEHGKQYQYCVREYRFNTINMSEDNKQILKAMEIDLTKGLQLSQMKTSPKVKADYEDLFIYDGERQLKVKYNPKVNSFKTILGDTKKTTIGSQYPFILRSGDMNYNEFPISGLLSYWMDNEELFLNRKDELHMPEDWENTTNMTADNTSYELAFKLAALKWLSDGKPKLVKSPTEGNYIVRLTDVSLTPVEQVARMLHTFTCNATEIMEYNVDNLFQYGFMKPIENAKQTSLISRVSLQSIWNKLAAKTYAAADSIGARVEYLTGLNLLPANAVLTKISFSDIKVPTQLVATIADQDAIKEPVDEHFNYMFNIGNPNIHDDKEEDSRRVITYCVNGGFEASYDESDEISSVTFDATGSSLVEYLLLQGEKAKIPGYIYYQTIAPAEAQIDTNSEIAATTKRDIVAHQVTGDGRTNILEELVDNVKIKLIHIYQFKAELASDIDKKFALIDAEKSLSVSSNQISIDGMVYEVNDILDLSDLGFMPETIIAGTNIKVTLTIRLQDIVYNVENDNATTLATYKQNCINTYYAYTSELGYYGSLKPRDIDALAFYVMDSTLAIVPQSLANTKNNKYLKDLYTDDLLTLFSTGRLDQSEYSPTAVQLKRKEYLNLRTNYLTTLEKQLGG